MSVAEIFNRFTGRTHGHMSIENDVLSVAEVAFISALLPYAEKTNDPVQISNSLQIPSPELDYGLLEMSDSNEKIGVLFLRDQYGQTHVRFKKVTPHEDEDNNTFDVSLTTIVYDSTGIRLVMTTPELSDYYQSQPNFGTELFHPPTSVVSTEDMISVLTNATNMLIQYDSLREPIPTHLIANDNSAV